MKKRKYAKKRSFDFCIILIIRIFVVDLNQAKHIINGILWSVIGLYVLLIVLTHVPPVQRFIGTQVSTVLSEKFGTTVKVGRVDLGFLNRIIIDDVLINDQQQQKMLRVARASVKFDITPLLDGKIVISSAQLFGLNANLYQTKEKKLNCQFVIDSLASKDTLSHTPLDLRISSLVVRNGAVTYNHSIRVRDISSHIMLYALKDDAIDVHIKHLSLKEACGFCLEDLQMKLIADKKGATISDLYLKLPHSELSLPSANATYRMVDNRFQMPTLTFNGAINESKITPSDIACFIPELKKINTPIYFTSSFSGTSSSLRIEKFLASTKNDILNVDVNGSINNWDATPKWYAKVNDIRLSASAIASFTKAFGGHVQIPAEIVRLGSIRFIGETGGYGKDISLSGRIITDAGTANVLAGKDDNTFSLHANTTSLNLQRILDDQKFGTISTDIIVKGNATNLTAKGDISRFDYNDYSYSNIQIDGIYKKGIFDGVFQIDDPNVMIDLKGCVNIKKKMPLGNLTLDVHHLNPRALKLSNTPQDFALRNIHLEAENTAHGNTLSLSSEYADMRISGQYEYTSLMQRITNLIGSKLPTLPGLPKQTNERNNNFNIEAYVYDGEWLRQITGIPLTLNQTLQIHGELADTERQLNLTCIAPDFVYDGGRYKNGCVRFFTPNDTLQAVASVTKIDAEGFPTYIKLNAAAADNKLSTLIGYDHKGVLPINGKLNIDTQFFKNEEGHDAAHMAVHTSEIQIGDSLWTIEPSDIVYSKNHLLVDHFAVYHQQQHIIVTGLATENSTDSLCIDLRDVDVNYITSLLDFHSVEFSGKASGKAHVSGIFKNPDAAANLTVKDFRFEDGRMGVLSVNAQYDNVQGQINLDAIAHDTENAFTVIKGYVSPKQNYIDLAIDAHDTRLEFMEKLCSSFMRNVDARAVGSVRLAGDLSNINLTGDVVANGKLGIKPVNCDYTLTNCQIHLIPDEIEFYGDTIHDKFGHIGIVTGAVHHEHLTRLSFDLNVQAEKLLSFDTHEFGDATFYGTVYATGNCSIHGRSGEVLIDVNATPEKGSQIVYNAASPDAISKQEFIQWIQRKPEQKDSLLLPLAYHSSADNHHVITNTEIPTDIRINFLINGNQNLTLKIVMDNETGDHIALNGDGVIRTTFYNKGTFDMFGTYTVDHGIYKLTIQNIIKKDFLFQPGGTIIFGGDPLNASLNLKAQYTVNGVSLSDLNIGRSFSTNNIRVNCLMNIGGIANSPQVDFSLDMPTVNADAKQMVYSLINSEEEMNQQVLYLLAIGKFYNQGNNNAGQEEGGQPSQTSLAMQSLLSGTISQQINNVLSSLLNNNNWNFGANISTGDEGWNNAEYEGLLSGRMLNNRLLFNGQFGYRDNVNTATTSFIGDFDLKYLLFPNGNLAVNVYNQTNDRYFTRNSLTTQGVGLIMKKDFNSLKDLFGIYRKKKKK